MGQYRGSTCILAGYVDNISHRSTLVKQEMKRQNWCPAALTFETHACRKNVFVTPVLVSHIFARLVCHETAQNIQGLSCCSPWLQTFITRKPKYLPYWNFSQPQENCLISTDHCISMHPFWRVCGKNFNIVSMCVLSPVVYISNFLMSKKIQFFCGCEQFH
jgi:hypothetical protein